MHKTSFWDQLPRPIIGLAPMDGIGDHPFRHIQKKHGKPQVIYTEFTSVEGLCNTRDTRMLRHFWYDESQRPIIGQIYGHTPRHFYQAAILLCELGFDGIDINMGCPAKSVIHAGSGAGLIRTPKLAQAIVRAVKTGIQDWQTGATIQDCPDIRRQVAAQVIAKRNSLPPEARRRRFLPTSVKTRIGFERPRVEEWIPALLEVEPVAIALHGRTLTQGYSGFANWDAIGKAAELVHKTSTLLLGNGDIKTLTDAHTRIATYGVDGVLIGRGSMGNPFIFFPEKHQALSIDSHGDLTENFALLKIALEHAHFFEQTYGHLDSYHFLPMRKHLGWYIRGLPGACELRTKLQKATNAQEATMLLNEFRHGS